MRIDIAKCAQSPFSDANWAMKVLIGTVLQFLSILLLPMWIFSGYFLKVIRQSAEGEEESLPEWDDWGGLLVDGLKFNVGGFLLAAIPTGLLLFGGGSMIVSLIGGLSGRSGAAAAAGIAGGTMALAALAIGGLLLLVLTLFAPALVIRYAVSGDFGALFGFGQALTDIMKAPLEYLIIWVAPVVGGMLLGVLTAITGGLGGILALPAGVILSLMVARMQGSFYRNCLKQ